MYTWYLVYYYCVYHPTMCFNVAYAYIVNTPRKKTTGNQQHKKQTYIRPYHNINIMHNKRSNSLLYLLPA